ncbi:hypothetical protein D3C73_1183050 [compost metagenome]
MGIFLCWHRICVWRAVAASDCICGEILILFFQRPGHYSVAVPVFEMEKVANEKANYKKRARLIIYGDFPSSAAALVSSSLTFTSDKKANRSPRTVSPAPIIAKSSDVISSPIRLLLLLLLLVWPFLFLRNSTTCFKSTLFNICICTLA